MATCYAAVGGGAVYVVVMFGDPWPGRGVSGGKGAKVR